MASSSQHQLIITPAGGSQFGAIAITEEMAQYLAGIGDNPASFNKITWRGAGCSRYSEAVILCSYANAQAALNGTLSNASTITIGNLSGTPTERFSAAMYLIEAKPIQLSFNTGGHAQAGMYALKFVDNRYFLKGIEFDKETGYNVTIPGSRSSYFTQSQSSGSPYSWAQIISDLTTAMGISPANNLTYANAGDPIDFIFQGESAAELLDRVLCALGACLVAQPNNLYTIDLIRNFNHTQANQEDSYVSERVGGGMIYAQTSGQFNKILNSAMPSSVTVRFPRQLSSVDDSANSTYPSAINQYYYQKSVTATASGIGVPGRAGYVAIINDTMWALGNPGSETNTSNLTTRASFVATSYYSRWQTFADSTRFRGIVNPMTGSNFNGFTGTITFCHTMQGTFTDFVNDFSMFPVGGDGDAISGKSISRVMGNGDIQAWRAFDGTVYLSSTNTDQRAKILSVASGSTPGPWAYIGQTPSGSNITLMNTMEPCDGSPGSLGVNVASNGTVNGGTCVVQSLGPNENFIPYYTDSNGTNWVTVPNSAQ